MKDILILGIETSCDETSASLWKTGVRCFQMLSHPGCSSSKIWRGRTWNCFKKACRAHYAVIHQSLEEAGIKIEQVDAIVWPTGPVWSEPFWSDFRRLSLAFALDKPLIGVHHIEGT